MTLIEQRISSLEQRVSRVEGQLSLFIKMFIAFNVPILVGIIGILLKNAYHNGYCRSEEGPDSGNMSG